MEYLGIVPRVNTYHHEAAVFVLVVERYQSLSNFLGTEEKTCAPKVDYSQFTIDDFLQGTAGLGPMFINKDCYRARNVDIGIAL